MAEHQPGRDIQRASLEAYVNELNELDPAKRSFAVAALLAPMIRHVRLYEADDATLAKIAECSLSPRPETDGFGPESAGTSGLLKYARLPPLVFETVKSALPAGTGIDFVVEDSGCVSVAIGQPPVLGGENLAALGQQEVPPSPEPPIPSAVADAFLSAAGAADLLGVAKSTVTRRVEKNEVIGFRTFTNALRIPTEQFVDGVVVAGIPEVLSMFTERSVCGETHTDHKGAWDFLSTTVYPGTGAPRPIDRLRAGMRSRTSAEVVADLAGAKESLDYGDHL